VTGDDEPSNFGGMLFRLRAEVEEVVEAIQAVSPRLSSMDARLNQLGNGLREAELRALAQDSAMRETTALARRLAARVEWLERNIRLTETAPEVDLDAAVPQLRELARAAETGNRARAGLLSPSARSGLAEAVQKHTDAVREFRSHREATLQACATLAGTGLHEGVHGAAVARFQGSVADMDLARQQLGRLAGAALDARRRLWEDDEEQARLAPELVGSDRAGDELNDVLRGRLAEAVGTGALLPGWFTDALGPMPPAHDTAGWMDAAVSLLAYRITYEVTDPVLALGPDPEGTVEPRRRAWRDELAKQFTRLHG
jgi:hypothetical protein